MTTPIVPVVPSSSSEGNTNTSLEKAPKKKQISPSKKWCFTLNNYTESEHELILMIFSSNSSKFIIGKEIAESGTHHLQGYVEWPRKIRPISLNLPSRIHWEKARGTRADNLVYCSKEGNFITNCVVAKPIKCIDESKFYSWQTKLLEMLLGPCCDRTVWWIYDEEGNKGKSAFCKFMCMKHNALMVDGKSSDIYQGLASHIETEGSAPEIVLIDCPRHAINYMNYGAIEKVKNGHVFSGKYESKQLIFNSPNVCIFANSLPDFTKYSGDRWIVYTINEKKELIEYDEEYYDN